MKQEIFELPQNHKSPKTQMDEDFLKVIEEIMPALNVSSDRAMSKVLSQHENFLSRIRTGIQSVPAAVWDILYDLFSTPELQHLGYFRPKLQYKGGKPRPEREPAISHQAPMSSDEEPGAARKKAIASYERELSAADRELSAAHDKISLLTSLLKEKERTIQILLNQPGNQDLIQGPSSPPTHSKAE